MFKDFMNLGGMANLMKSAEELQSKMDAAKESMEKAEVIGEAGAGLVKARVNGRGALVGLEIDPGIFKAEDKVVVEDLIVAAVGDGVSKANEKRSKRDDEVDGRTGIAAMDEGTDLITSIFCSA